MEVLFIDYITLIKYGRELDRLQRLSKLFRCDFEEIDIYKNIISEEMDPQILIRSIRNNDSKYRRVKKRINYMLKNGQCFFCTFTINDEYMNRDHSRKLKQLFNGYNYIFNVDYGKNTNRKHYHGVVMCSGDMPVWPYGFYNYKPIKAENDINLSKYITKFTAHTLKEKTEKIIYSRARA